MRHVPRLAVGTIHPGADRRPVTWALLSALQQLHASPLCFHASCRLSGQDPSRAIEGRPTRYLDSWVMSRGDAIASVTRSSADTDLVLVCGDYDSALPLAQQSGPCASSLNKLCEWLDLPRIAIVDVRSLPNCASRASCQGYDALLLDRVENAGAAAYWQTTLEALCGVPVAGWLPEAPHLRKQAAAVPSTTNPPRELCEALAGQLLPTLRLDRLRHLARRAAPLAAEPDPWLLRPAGRRFRIAVAFDEAFHCYYPETLDLLEATGAELIDFSPLRSESLPPQSEIVYFGCGHPENYLSRLAANHCLMQSLRCHAASGGRVYAEGGGVPYLCREIALADGQVTPGVGLLPVTARLVANPPPAEPCELIFGASSWLAPASFSLRGYRHSGWNLDPRGPMLTYARHPAQRLDMLGRGNVIGSRILVNLAANRHLLRRFFEPYALPAAARHH